jgi:hypothetical protein
MDAVRYRPGEALRWLSTGADAQRKSARKKGKTILSEPVEVSFESLRSTVSTAAGALFELGQGAYTELVRTQADAHEFVLGESDFSISRQSGPRIYRYADVTKIEWERDRATLTVGQTRVVIKPYAYITAGRVRVPIGWDRNGMEVPFELLIEELAARCKVEIDTK